MRDQPVSTRRSYTSHPRLAHRQGPRPELRRRFGIHTTTVRGLGQHTEPLGGGEPEGHDCHSGPTVRHTSGRDREGHDLLVLDFVVVVEQGEPGGRERHGRASGAEGRLDGQEDSVTCLPSLVYAVIRQDQCAVRNSPGSLDPKAVPRHPRGGLSTAWLEGLPVSGSWTLPGRRRRRCS
jgi:hypothetical protein